MTTFFRSEHDIDEALFSGAHTGLHITTQELLHVNVGDELATRASMDAWFDEDEEVQGHLRDPYHLWTCERPVAMRALPWTA